MLEPPALPEHKILEALRAGYGVEAAALTFLPLGQDGAAWVYRVTRADGPAYFLKLRRSGLNPASLAVPRYLSDQGLAEVIAPVRTLNQAVYHVADGYSLILYPFIEDAQPLASGRADAHWRRFGAALRQIHATALPPELMALMPRDTFTPVATERVRQQDTLIANSTFDEPLARDLAALWRGQHGPIHALVERAEAIGQNLRRRSDTNLVLCHADPHWSNVLVDKQSSLWLVDWDETGLSLKERDLMFVIGGLTPEWGTPRDTGLFFQGYGPAEVDPLALAYYRADWALQDIENYAHRVLAVPAEGEATRREALDFFKGLFGLGAIVEKALGSAVATR